MFYLAAEALFAGIRPTGLAIVFVDIYSLLPFIVVAGLSVFPLTILESAVVGFAALAAMAVGPPLSHHVDLDAYFAACWTLFLLIWVSVLAAAIQLNYMMSLVQRISVDQPTGAYTRDRGKELIVLYFHISLEKDTPFDVAEFRLLVDVKETVPLDRLEEARALPLARLEDDVAVGEDDRPSPAA